MCIWLTRTRLIIGLALVSTAVSPTDQSLLTASIQHQTNRHAWSTASIACRGIIAFIMIACHALKDPKKFIKRVKRLVELKPKPEQVFESDQAFEKAMRQKHTVLEPKAEKWILQHIPVAHRARYKIVIRDNPQYTDYEAESRIIGSFTSPDGMHGFVYTLTLSPHIILTVKEYLKTDQPSEQLRNAIKLTKARLQHELAHIRNLDDPATVEQRAFLSQCITASLMAVGAPELISHTPCKMGVYWGLFLGTIAGIPLVTSFLSRQRESRADDGINTYEGGRLLLEHLAQKEEGRSYGEKIKHFLTGDMLRTHPSAKKRLQRLSARFNRSNCDNLALD